MSTQLSRREKVLLSVVVGAVGIFLNLFLISYFLKNNASLRASLGNKQAQLTALQTMLRDTPKWQQRNEWLKAHQQRLDNAEGASVQLIDQVTAIARKHTILLDSPQPTQAVRRPEYTSVPVKIGAKGTWENMVDFLYELQGPEKFIVLESASLTKDAQDPTQMQASLSIAKWYAPN